MNENAAALAQAVAHFLPAVRLQQVQRADGRAWYGLGILVVAKAST